MRIHFNLCHHSGINTRINNIAYLRSMFVFHNIKNVELDYKVIDTKTPYGNYELNNKYGWIEPFIMGKTIIDLNDLPTYVKMLDNFKNDKDILNDVIINDLMIFPLKQTREFYDTYLDYDYLCISLFNNHFIYQLYAALLAKRNNLKIKIVFGGPQITLSKWTRELLNVTGLFDYILGGDVESSILKLINGELEEGITMVEEYDMNKLKTPIYYPNEILLDDAIMITTSRSCPFHCGFCVSNNLGRFRFVPIDDVLEAIYYYNSKTLFRKIIKRIYFNDSTLNFSEKRINELLDGIILQNSNSRTIQYGDIPLKSYYSTKFLNTDIIDKAKEANFYHMSIGYDGVTDEQNSMMHLDKKRKMSIDEYTELIRYIKNKDIITTITFIMGCPGETENEFLAQKEALIKLFDLNKGNERLVRPVPYQFELQAGSPIYDHPEKFNVEFETWDELDCSPDINDIVTKIPKNYYCDTPSDVVTERFNFFLDYIPDWCFQ